jgi:hypothetical protein
MVRQNLVADGHVARFDCYMPRLASGRFLAGLVRMCVAEFLALTDRDRSFQDNLNNVRANLVPSLKGERNLCPPH